MNQDQDLSAALAADLRRWLERSVAVDRLSRRSMAPALALPSNLRRAGIRPVRRWDRLTHG
jgi:hypothetical protein